MDCHSLYDAELLAGSYHPRVEAYYFKQWDGYSMPFHAHDDIEIMYVIQGKCVVQTESDELRLKKGDLILLDACVRHRLTIEEGSSCRILNLEFVFAGQTGSFPAFRETAAGNAELAEMLLFAQPYLLLRDSAEIYQLLKNIVFELDENGNTQSWMVLLMMNELLIRIARLAREAGSGGKPYDIYIRQSVAYLLQYYDRDIRVKDVAAEVNVHPGYLQRIFKKKMGQTVMEYLTALRIGKAKMLLARTDLPVADIAETVGINSREYFSALFKKHAGQPPNEYRKSFETIAW